MCLSVNDQHLLVMSVACDGKVRTAVIIYHRHCSLFVVLSSSLSSSHRAYGLTRSLPLYCLIMVVTHVSSHEVSECYQYLVFVVWKYCYGEEITYHSYSPFIVGADVPPNTADIMRFPLRIRQGICSSNLWAMFRDLTWKISSAQCTYAAVAMSGGFF